MRETIAFDYDKTRLYAINLYNMFNPAYEASKKAEAIVILIGLDTGLRISDMLNLKFTDIAIDKEYNKPLLTVKIRKTGNIETKPLHSSTYRIIEAYQDWKKFILNDYHPNIFNNNGKNFTRQWAHKRINIANDKSLLGKRVEVAGSHSLRRTAASNIYDKTKDLRDVQFLLGHRKVSQTEHYLKQHKVKALDKLTQLYD